MPSSPFLKKADFDFNITENILLQDTPPDSPISFRTPRDESHQEFFDPTASYSVQYQGHTVHIDPIDWRHSSLLVSQIACCFFIFSLAGLADQTIGTLMPMLVEHFHASQTRVTTIFMVGFLGYTTAAFVNEKLHSKFGRRGVLLIGCLGPIITYAINSTHDSLPLFVSVYIIVGFGNGLVGNAVNVFLSSVTDHNEMMGMLHGFYGVGSIISPPLVSWIAANWGYKLFYMILSSLYILAFIGFSMFFKHETKWKYAYNMRSTGEDGVEMEPTSGLDMIKNKMILAFCTYLFFYVGGEISIGSWLLTYLKDMKGLEQLEASIVVSWFWFGLTFGRMSLAFLTKKFRSEYSANKWYGWLSWVTYTVFLMFSMTYDGDNFSLLAKPLVFIAGVFIGPLYPTASVVLFKLLPIHQQVSGVGIASSIGGSGSAVVPFIVGASARSLGFKWLLVIIDIVLFVYCLVWEAVPTLAGIKKSW
uniref:MFS transporter n=1 Tax=Cyberlindnera americana TaxID=36016 RepID=A0A5P8N8Q7_9ASCO|nr:MFS transporter [Cyberlindnera americana]